jgi:hypothetical protein
MEVKDQFISMRPFQLQDSNHIRFWEDAWLGANALKNQYPNLYNIIRKKSATIAEVFSTRPLNVPVDVVSSYICDDDREKRDYAKSISRKNTVGFRLVQALSKSNSHIFSIAVLCCEKIGCLR